MATPLVIDYYTDVLCIWAWIAQRRIEELEKQWPGKIELKYHYVDIFGNVPEKMANQWQARGGYDGFAQHVQHSAADYENAPVHSELWQQVRPATSANAHLFLKAIELQCGCHIAAEMALCVRKAFFIENRDIGQLETLYVLAAENQLDVDAIQQSVENGTAMAALMSDYQKARQQGIKGSPSYVMDGGRQVLYGNVGYRVLSANVEELLKNPQDEASWC